MNWTALAAAILALVGAIVFATNSPPPWAIGLALTLTALVVFLDERRNSGLFKRPASEG